MATVRTSLSWRERAFVGWMHPRGIVAASTAAGFGAPLAASGIEGADDLVPVTFVVIMATVTIYGLTAGSVSRRLGLAESVEEERDEPDRPDEPAAPPPVGGA